MWPSPAEAPPADVRPSWLPRWLLLGIAWASLGIALVAVFVPGLPTTEFLLLATWSAARCSPRLHAWLWGHRLFGPLLRNWHDGKRVALGAKISATISMGLCAGLMLYTLPAQWWLYASLAGMTAGNLWLWSRPR